MKIPGEKPKNLIDLISNNNEAVKVSTRSSQTSVVSATATEASGKTHYHTSNANEAASDRATSIKFGLAKHIAEEFDSKKGECRSCISRRTQAFYVGFNNRGALAKA